MPMLPLVLSSDSHVFEPPDLWQTRIDAAFRDRAPRIERIDGGDHVVVEADQILSGIGLISNAGARFEAPETISAQGRFEDVLRGGYDPEQHLKDMALDGVAGEVLYPSQGLFYFKVADPQLMSAIFRAYNDWLAEFCRTDPARLKGIAMINLDDVEDGGRARSLASIVYQYMRATTERGTPVAGRLFLLGRGRRGGAFTDDLEHGITVRIPAVRTDAIYEIKSPIVLEPGAAALTDGLKALQAIITRVEPNNHGNVG
jgi:hypothetical protein